MLRIRGHVFPQPESLKVKKSLHDLMVEVCTNRRVGTADVLSHCRLKRLVRVRREIWWRAHMMGYSYPQIGDFFLRDHSTVLIGVRRYKASIPTNRTYPQPSGVLGHSFCISNNRF